MARQGMTYEAVVRTAKEWRAKAEYALNVVRVFDPADVPNREAALKRAEEHLADVLAWDE